jgi:glyoxylase-like metal-dependent hydrolase (beta-lactamase superfamily II)
MDIVPGAPWTRADGGSTSKAAEGKRSKTACPWPGAGTARKPASAAVHVRARVLRAFVPKGVNEDDNQWPPERQQQSAVSSRQSDGQALMELIFEQIRTGGDRNFGYLLADRTAGQGVLIDPSYAPDVLVQRSVDQGLRIAFIINTHGHSDHINGNARASTLTGAPIAAHPASPAAPAVPLSDDQELRVGGLTLRIFHTPGHCDDHLVVYEPTFQLLVTGDLLFVGKVGGTPNDNEARQEWTSLRRLLAAIPEAATVWPGHDYGVRPSSTIALEKQSNPFLRCPDLDAFLQLKRDWPGFKQLRGLK